MTEQFHIKRNEVYRPKRPWSKSIQSFLGYLSAQGFGEAPSPLGLTANQEIVSYIPGSTSEFPDNSKNLSLECMQSAAHLLRKYHKFSMNFINGEMHKRLVWQLPEQLPIEVICHADFAPYNVVFRGNSAIGIIDFETAHPGPIIWDLAYAVYRFCPLMKIERKDLEIDNQLKRLRMFLNSYGKFNFNKQSFTLEIIERLESLIKFISYKAQEGDIKYSFAIKNGHVNKYKDDLVYLQNNQLSIDEIFYEFCSE